MRCRSAIAVRRRAAPPPARASRRDAVDVLRGPQGLHPRRPRPRACGTVAVCGLALLAGAARDVAALLALRRRDAGAGSHGIAARREARQISQALAPPPREIALLSPPPPAAPRAPSAAAGAGGDEDGAHSGAASTTTSRNSLHRQSGAAPRTFAKGERAPIVHQVGVGERAAYAPAPTTSATRRSARCAPPAAGDRASRSHRGCSAAAAPSACCRRRSSPGVDGWPEPARAAFDAQGPAFAGDQQEHSFAKGQLLSLMPTEADPVGG